MSGYYGNVKTRDRQSFICLYCLSMNNHQLLQQSCPTALCVIRKYSILFFTRSDQWKPLNGAMATHFYSNLSAITKMVPTHLFTNFFLNLYHFLTGDFPYLEKQFKIRILKPRIFLKSCHQFCLFYFQNYFPNQEWVDHNQKWWNRVRILTEASSLHNLEKDMTPIILELCHNCSQRNESR